MAMIIPTKPTANKAVSALVDVGVHVETSGRRHDRMFGYAACMDRLRAGTELGRARQTLPSPNRPGR
jgi:hypothetical protein